MATLSDAKCIAVSRRNRHLNLYPSGKHFSSVPGGIYGIIRRGLFPYWNIPKCRFLHGLVKSSGVMKALFTLKDIRVEARVPGGRPSLWAMSPFFRLAALATRRNGLRARIGECRVCGPGSTTKEVIGRT